MSLKILCLKGFPKHRQHTLKFRFYIFALKVTETISPKLFFIMSFNITKCLFSASLQSIGSFGSYLSIRIYQKKINVLDQALKSSSSTQWILDFEMHSRQRKILSTSTSSFSHTIHGNSQYSSKTMFTLQFQAAGFHSWLNSALAEKDSVREEC